MRVYILPTVLTLLLWQAAVAQPAQRPGGKPVLIRDEVDKRVEEEKIPIHDPEQARKSLEIAVFYQKRGNLKAAEERFREAVDYNKPWTEPYNRLIEMLEKADRLEDAVAVCDLYVENNLGSSKTNDFIKRKEQLMRKLPPE
jgi:tetratricopeptide (TPR) repeat protein